MSNFKHRQPIWGWGSVVILSTLLLSPVTAATVLRALVQAMPQNAALPADAAGKVEHGQPVPSPRRSHEEEEALRAAARSGQVRAVRLDSDPDDPAAAHCIAVVLPARSVQCVPDDARLAALNGRPDDHAVSPRPVRDAVPPRAPPFSVA